MNFISWLKKQIKVIADLEKNILSSFTDYKPQDAVKAQERYYLEKEKLKVMQDCHYAVCTPEEIQFIVSGQAFDQDYSWSSNELSIRATLPKDMYCTHEEWSKNPKLKALMPSKRF